MKRLTTLLATAMVVLGGVACAGSEGTEEGETADRAGDVTAIAVGAFPSAHRLRRAVHLGRELR